MKKNNIVIWLFVIVMSGLLFCFGSYAESVTRQDNLKDIDTNQQPDAYNKKEKKEEKKKEAKKEASTENTKATETTKTKTGSKKADINKNLIQNLYDSKAVISLDASQAITKDIDFTLDYGKINDHNLKIKIYNTESITTSSSISYTQKLDVYVDGKKYNLYNVE